MRHKRRLAWIAAAGLLLAWSGGAAWADEPDLKLEVRRLVRQLNDRRVEQRDDAERALLELGPSVLEQLPEVNDRMPAEVRHRLERVRQTLEGRAARAAVAPSTVTIQGEDLALDEVLEKIAEQTKNGIDTRAQQIEPAVAARRVDVHFDNEPFWPALDALLDQTELGLYFFSAGQSVSLVNRSPGQLPYSGRVTYSGPFRFEPKLVTAVRDLTQPGNQVLKLRVQIAWEPRLRPIVLTQPLDKIEAVDAAGKALSVENPMGELAFEIHPGMGAVEMELPFALPSRDVQKIATLRGEMRALVPGGVETFRFENIERAKDVEQRKGGVLVTLENMRPNNDLWTARVRVAFAATDGALESHRSWIANNVCYLVDAEGKKYENLGFDSTLRTRHAVGFAYLFDLPDGPQGLTLVYKTPAAIVNLPVKYELKDIPLP